MLMPHYKVLLVLLEVLHNAPLICHNAPPVSFSVCHLGALQLLINMAALTEFASLFNMFFKHQGVKKLSNHTHMCAQKENTPCLYYFFVFLG